MSAKMTDRQKHQAQTMLNYLTWHPDMIDEYEDEELRLLEQLLDVPLSSDRKTIITRLKDAINKYKTTPKRPAASTTKLPSKAIDEDELEIIEPQPKKSKVEPQPKAESVDSIIELISPKKQVIIIDDSSLNDSMPELEHETEPDSKPQVKQETPEPTYPKVESMCTNPVQFAPDATNMRPEYNPEISVEYLNNDLRIIERMMKELPHCSTVVNTLGDKFQTTEKALLETLKHIYSQEVNLNDLNYRYIQCFVRDLLSCNYDSAFYNAELIQVISKQMQPHIRLEKIQTVSQHSIVWKAFVKQTSSPFAVLKMQKNLGAASIINELAIGLILNQLRDTIPYFAYTYAGFYCNKTGKDDELGCKQITSGASKELVALTFQEYVDHEYSASEFLLHLQSKKNVDVLSKAIDEVLLQVAYALYKAQQSYQYIHNDLHSENVLMKKTNPRANVVLKLDNRLSIDFPKVTDRNFLFTMPVIIDFGDSSVVVIEGSKQTRLCNPKERGDGIKDTVAKWPLVPTGVDIFRFSTSLLVKLMEKAPNPATKKMLEDKYTKCIALFRLHTDQIQTPGMKDVIQSYNLSTLEKLIHASSKELARLSVTKKVNMKIVMEAVKWARLKDIGLFQVSMYDWINHYLQGKP